MASLEGWRVAALESRRQAEMERLIKKQGAEPLVVPALREAPLSDSRPIVDFAHRLLIGQIDVVVFLTATGFRALFEQAQRHVKRESFLDSLRDICVITRGPKPTAALKEVGVEPDFRTSSPDTWREVLTLIDEKIQPAQQTIAIQEYGETNASLIAGLEARGADVVSVPVYRYELPEDTAPLESLVKEVVQGEIDAILLTTAQQATHLKIVAEQLELFEALRNAGRQLIVASIGPTTTAAVESALEWSVDLEPKPAKMGQLVKQFAEQAMSLREKKRNPSIVPIGEPDHDGQTQQTQAWFDSPFMKACRGEPTPFTPIWLMRQAGRYMADYREIREKTSFMDLCRNPKLCSEVMCTAVERLGVDAAIIFSDLLPILEPMGLQLEFAAGDGPVIHNPVRSAEDVKRVNELESVDPLEFVMEAVRQTRADLPPDLPLIGFAGAPFTLASYMIEGGGSRHYLHTKTLMYRDPSAWETLMQRLTRAVARYLNAQIAAGAQCVQIFDSWVGCLGPQDYRSCVLPYVRELVRAIEPSVPVIYFGTGNPALVPAMAEAGSQVVGVDWRMKLDEAWEQIGFDRAIQGNLDPATLLADPSTIRKQAAEILEQAQARPGHIFNLGHGVLPQTPVENVVALVKAVHELSARP